MKCKQAKSHNLHESLHFVSSNYNHSATKPSINISGTASSQPHWLHHGPCVTEYYAHKYSGHDFSDFDRVVTYSFRLLRAAAVLGGWEIKNADIECMRWARDISLHEPPSARVSGYRTLPQSLDIKRRGNEWYREIFKDFPRICHIFKHNWDVDFVRAGAALISIIRGGVRIRERVEIISSSALSRRGPATTHWYATENYSVAGKTMAPTFHYKLRGWLWREGGGGLARQLPGGQEKIKIKITRKTRKICQIR